MPYVFTKNDFESLDEKTNGLVQGIFENCNTMLGGVSVDVYLEPEDYETALSNAILKYRQMSARSIKFGLGLLETEKDRQEYTLGENVDTVRAVRRVNPYSFGAGTLDNPIALAIFQKMASEYGSGGFDLVTYDMYLQHLETIRRLFAYEPNWSWDESNRILTLHKRFNDGERLLLEVSVIKSVRELMNDHFAYSWLQDYTLALSKIILGTKLTVFEIMPGPTGGVTTGGNALKQSGMEEKQALEDQLLDMADSPEIPIPIRG